MSCSQNSGGQREESQGSHVQEATHCKERCSLRPVHPTPRTDRIYLPGERKDQGPHDRIQKEVCHDPRRREVDGHGPRLICLPFSATYLAVLVSLVIIPHALHDRCLFVSLHHNSQVRRCDCHEQNVRCILYNCRRIQTKRKLKLYALHIASSG